MGRGKVVLKRIENPSSRQVTFSKRRNGLLKKAFELSILCDAEVALLIFSSSGKLFQFASHDMERTVAKYRNEVGLPTSDNRPESSTIEFWRNETLRLTRSIDDLEAKLNHIAGENLSSLGMKELRQLERQLKTGVERIRSKKASCGQRRLISEHINMLKRNHKTLQEENLRLQKRVKLNEVDDGNTSSMMFSADDDACEYPYQRTFLDGC